MILIAMALASSMFCTESPSTADLEFTAAQFQLPWPRKDNLTDDKISAGLKEALRVGATNAVGLTGRLDGYFKNEAIKILMPKELRTMEKGLRTVGLGPKVDEFVLSMNRAAEKAAPAAKGIFLEAIRGITFDEARKILTGGDTAVTQYFKEKTSTQLAAAFLPIVKKTTDETGVTHQYKELVGQFQGLPFMKTQTLNIDDYVVVKGLDGLFFVLGEEERKIRKDPAAQVTKILKDVFGRRAQ